MVSLICVDNEAIRKRVCEDKKITISSLPCILCMFMNGTVETYEGSFAFQCIDSLIEKLSPPRPPEPVQEQFAPPPPPQPAQQMAQQQAPPQQTRKQAAQTVQRMQSDRLRQGNGQVEIPVNPSITSIDEVMNLPEEEEEEPVGQRPGASFQDEEEENEAVQPPDDMDDRHRIIPGPKRLQTADGNYEESEDLFAGERVDNRRQPAKTIKPHVKKAEKDPNGIMAKAKELARGRDQVEETINKPGSRGVFTRDNPN